MKMDKGGPIAGLGKNMKGTKTLAEASPTPFSTKSTATTMTTKDTGQHDAPFLKHTSK